MTDDDERLRPHSCPRCLQQVKVVWRWSGKVVVAVGFKCPTTLCGYRVMRPAWRVVAVG